MFGYLYFFYSAESRRLIYPEAHFFIGPFELCGRGIGRLGNHCLPVKIEYMCMRSKGRPRIFSVCSRVVNILKLHRPFTSYTTLYDIHLVKCTFQL
jgi:hypothetical protein